MLVTIVALVCVTPAFSKTLYVFDAEAYFHANPDKSVAWQADTLRLLAALQGLVNRPHAPIESGRSIPDTLLYVLYLREGISGHQASLDGYWLGYLRRPGRLLATYDMVEVQTLEELLILPDIAEHYTGVVLWDEMVPATANVAMTLAGVRDLLPIRHSLRSDPGGLHSQLIEAGPRLKVQLTLAGKFTGYGTLPDTQKLTPSSRSRKCDAYLWAVEQALEPKLCSDRFMAYYLDGVDWDPTTPGWQCSDLSNAGLLNADFFVSEKAFFFDLDPWWDEIAPDDLLLSEKQNLPEDPQQGKDEETLKYILRTLYRNHNGQNFVAIGGFVPWFVKYSTEAKHYTGRHTPEECEWEFVAMATAHNCFVEGDAYALAGLGNASVLRHAELAARYEQNPVPREAQVEAQLGDIKKHTYLLFYMGDYDSPAWMAHAIPTVWDDAYRGRIDLAWGFNPSVAVRGAALFEHVFETKTKRDFFVGGNSGFGYLHPHYLGGNREYSPYGSALEPWWRYARGLFRRFDYQITGLVINGNGGPISPALQGSFFHFSPHGVVSQSRFFQSLSREVVPFTQLAGDLAKFHTDVDDIVERIASHPVEGMPNFQAWRCILATPTNLYIAAEELKKRYPDRGYEVVDPYTFFYLLREHLGGSNNYLGLVLDHDIPAQMDASEAYRCHVRMRNDGWDTWNIAGTPPDGRYRLAYHWVRASDENEVLNRSTSYIPGPIGTGEKVDVEILVEAPPEQGLYRLWLYLEQEGGERSKLYEDVYIYVSA